MEQKIMEQKVVDFQVLTVVDGGAGELQESK